jgi:hypothetical protein
VAHAVSRASAVICSELYKLEDLGDCRGGILTGDIAWVSFMQSASATASFWRAIHLRAFIAVTVTPSILVIFRRPVSQMEAPELYAESATQFLVSYLLSKGMLFNFLAGHPELV